MHPFINDIVLNLSLEDTICEAKSTVLTATTNATSVSWSASIPSQNGTLCTFTSFTPTAAPVVTSEFYVIALLGSCSVRDSITVIVNPAPVPDAGDNFTICHGGHAHLNGSGGAAYLWHAAIYLSNPAISDPVVSEANPVTYYLDVTDTNGCRSLASSSVHVNVLPPSTLFAGYDTIVALHQPLQLFATDINHVAFVEYYWSPSEGLSNPFIHNPVALLNAANTDLVVTAFTTDHCMGVDTIHVKTYKGPEIYVAGSFTPNGDGKNDVLKAFPVGIKSFRYFNIYNRYGQLVFSTTNENVGWDGRYLGAIQQLSSFVWIAAGVDYKGRLVERKGTTTIIQ